MHYEVDLTVPAGNGWAGVVQKGQRFRIANIEGNEAVETRFFDAENHLNRYPGEGTVADFQSGQLAPGSRLTTGSGTALMSVAPCVRMQKQYIELVAETDTLVMISNKARDRGEDGFRPLRLLLWNP